MSRKNFLTEIFLSSLINCLAFVILKQGKFTQNPVILVVPIRISIQRLLVNDMHPSSAFSFPFLQTFLRS